jgi:hypothetical protein
MSNLRKRIKVGDKVVFKGYDVSKDLSSELMDASVIEVGDEQNAVLVKVTDTFLWVDTSFIGWLDVKDIIDVIVSDGNKMLEMLEN